MKTLLGCLMCFVLMFSQAFAISGGPFSGNGRVAVTGTYAGVLVPVPQAPGTDNSLALFTVTIPQSGTGTGAAVIFRRGFLYPGTVNAVGDPNSSRITAIVNGSFSKTFTRNAGDNEVSFTFNFNATGTVDARVAASRTSFSTSAVRMRGTASIDYTTEDDPNNVDFERGNSGVPVPYTVQGFKQSNATN